MACAITGASPSFGPCSSDLVADRRLNVLLVRTPARRLEKGLLFARISMTAALAIAAKKLLSSCCLIIRDSPSVEACKAMVVHIMNIIVTEEKICWRKPHIKI